MLLVIDNYDSFTYNLVQYLGELGETVEVRRNDRVTVQLPRGTPAGTSCNGVLNENPIGCQIPPARATTGMWPGATLRFRSTGPTLAHSFV